MPSNLLWLIPFLVLGAYCAYLIRQTTWLKDNNDLLVFQLQRYAAQIAGKDIRIDNLSERNHDLAVEVRQLQEALGAAQYYCEQADQRIEELESMTDAPLLFSQSRGWLIDPVWRN